MKVELPRVYPITDSRISGLSHAEQVERLVAGGARFIQLREKYAPSGEFYYAALQAIRVARQHGARVIINDRVDIAMAIAADGVHLGQDDLPPIEARRILGPNAIIGYSTHSIDQAVQAYALPVNYIAIGPVFKTGSKADPGEPLGVKTLSTIRNMIGDRDLVAIGGITRENVRSVLAAGVDSAAIISDLLSSGSGIEKRTRELITMTNAV